MASHRRTGAAAVAVLLASLSLYPVFTGIAWFWAGLGSVIVVALVGTATRLRRLPVAVVVLAYVVGLLLYLNLAFASSSSFAQVVPTPASLTALGHAASQGFSESSRYAPPVPALRGLMLLAAGGIGLAALLTDLIAVRLGRAALAGLPLLLLFVEPFTLSVSRGFLGTTIAFAATIAGYLALLSSESRDRIRDWEQADEGERLPDTRDLAAAGRRVGFASVVLALVIPLLVPGLHVTRLFAGSPGIGGKGGHGNGNATGSVGFPDPFAQVTQELHTSQPTPVLVYSSTTPSPDYLQVYTLDNLTADKGFQLFGRNESLAPVSPQLPPPPGLDSPSSLTSVRTNIEVLPAVPADALGALPAPYPATQVQAGGTLHADRSTLMVFDTGVALGGLHYSVTSLASDPSPADLNQADQPVPADIARSYLTVPPAYQALLPLAESKVHGAATLYQEAVDLQNWLSHSGGFSYTLTAPTVHDEASLKKFLTVTKAGYCQQFASAMAVLARLLGIPARVAEGFTSGSPNGKGNWVVTTHDAHLWPELYFQGYGWLRFEPTPAGVGVGQGTAYPPTYAPPPQTSSSADGSSSAGAGGAEPTTAASAQSRAHIPQTVLNQLNQLDQQDRAGGQAQAAGGVSPWAVLGLVVAGLALLAAVTPWFARRLIRRRRWLSRPPRADRVRARDVHWAHAAWQELRDDLVDYGAGYQPSETPRATAARAAQRLRLAGPARDALGRIALAEERARYAPAPADGSGLRADSAAVRRAIAAAVPRAVRWRARLLPASVVSRTLNGLAAAGDRMRAVRLRRV